MSIPTRAKVFKNGRSQAVRIPAQYRFNTDHVYVERDSHTGGLIVSEQPAQSTRADRIRRLFQEIDAEEGIDFALERDLRPEAEREEW